MEQQLCKYEVNGSPEFKSTPQHTPNRLIVSIWLLEIHSLCGILPFSDCQNCHNHQSSNLYLTHTPNKIPISIWLLEMHSLFGILPFQIVGIVNWFYVTIDI